MPGAGWVVVAAIGALATSSTTVAQTWNCTISSAENSGATITERWEINGPNLLGYSDEYTGKPVVFAVLQNTRYGVIAIRHEPTKGIVVTIDRSNGKFSETAIEISGSQERFVGICNKS